MNIASADNVKELRDRTGAGMMDCKAALLSSGGDIEKAAGSAIVDIAANAIITDHIGMDQVTYPKIQDVTAISRLLGRGSAAGVGNVEEITLGTNLSMNGTTLNAAGGAGASQAFVIAMATVL